MPKRTPEEWDKRIEDNFRILDEEYRALVKADRESRKKLQEKLQQMKNRPKPE